MLNDLNESRIRQGESMNQFSGRMDIKLLRAITAGVEKSEQKSMDMLVNGIEPIQPT